jgi:hypothetical protein
MSYCRAPEVVKASTDQDVDSGHQASSLPEVDYSLSPAEV